MEVVRAKLHDQSQPVSTEPAADPGARWQVGTRGGPSSELGKMGVKSRTQAVAIAARDGLFNGNA
jgi:hypothetical protein